MLVKRGLLVRQVCSLRAVFICRHAGEPSSHKHHCVCNEISCPFAMQHECMNRASVASSSDVYQPRAPSDGHRTSVSRDQYRRHTDSPQSEAPSCTQSYLCLTKLYLRGGFPHAHTAYYVQAYQRVELIKPYPQPPVNRMRQVGLEIPLLN